jgi:hypothetical protein
LLERLRDLSLETVADLSTDPGKRKQWRLHDINWSSKNVPIARKDFSWIDNAYLNNDTEYPFQQFQISKALGRVVGFVDELGTFNIVLLDPLHNAQPSSFNAYKVRETVVTDTHFARVMVSIEAKIAACGQACACRKIYGDLQSVLTSDVSGKAMIVGMSDEMFARATACVSSGVANSMAELIELGIAEVDPGEG